MLPADLRFRQGEDWSVTLTVTQSVRWSAGIDVQIAAAVRDAALDAGVTLAGEVGAEWVPLRYDSAGRLLPCDPMASQVWHYVATYRTIEVGSAEALSDHGRWVCGDHTDGGDATEDAGPCR